MDGPALVQRLLVDVPAVEHVVREHPNDDDDLLLDLALREGDRYVQDAVLVSFVEGAGAFRRRRRSSCPPGHPG
ncbi:hypothetical protein GCM10028777_37620 [Angustibacter speluncae]